MSLENTTKPPTENTPGTGASAAGFHFYQLFQCCPYKAFLRNVLGLDTMHVGPALIRGRWVHSGIETFYRDGDVEAAAKVTRAGIENSIAEFEHIEDYDAELTRAPEMTRSWCASYGLQDLYDYDEFMLEQEIEIVLDEDPQFRYTCRVDRLAHDPNTDEWDMFDTKTSTFSKKDTFRGYALSDQVTAYWGAVERGLGIKLRHAYCDVAYYHKRAKQAEPERSEPITKTPGEVNEFFEALAGQFADYQHRVDMVMSGGVPAHVAFPRNTHYCNHYFRECEFAGICRNNNTITSEPPGIGTLYKQGPRLRALAAYTTDSIGHDS